MGLAEWDFALVSQDTAALSAPSQSVLVQSVLFAFHVDSKFLFLFFKVTHDLLCGQLSLCRGQFGSD